jgi:hypothetical protein
MSTILLFVLEISFEGEWLDLKNFLGSNDHDWVIDHQIQAPAKSLDAQINSETDINMSLWGERSLEERYSPKRVKKLQIESAKRISRYALATSMKLSESMERKIWWCTVEFKSIASFPLWNRIWMDSDKTLSEFLRRRSSFVWVIDPLINADTNKLFIKWTIVLEWWMDISSNAKQKLELRAS